MAALLVSTATAGETKILEERFAANDRTNANLPTTAAWYYSSTTLTTDFTSEITDNIAGALTMNTSGGGRTLLAQFTPVTLASVGDSLSLTFSFTGTVGSNTGARNFRFGMFSSGTGSLVSADSFGSAFTGYSGYMMALNTTSGASQAGRVTSKTSGSTLLSTGEATVFGANAPQRHLPRG